MENNHDSYVEYLIIEEEKRNNKSLHSDSEEEVKEEKSINQEEKTTSNLITADMLKQHFAATRQRKYSLPRIFTFLEENIFVGYYCVPNFDINNYQDFSRDFDKMLDSGINQRTKNLIIEKFGLFNNKPLSYPELALKYNCSVSKMYADINRSIPKILKNTYYVDVVKSYFNLKSKQTKKNTKQEDIDYILNIARELESGGKND